MKISASCFKDDEIRNTINSSGSAGLCEVTNQKGIVVDIEDFSDFFSKFENITKKYKNEIISRISIFPEEEQEKLLNFAYELYSQNHARSISYIIQILVEWDLEEVRKLEDAKRIHLENYGEIIEEPKKVVLSDDFLNAMNLWKD